MTPEQQAAVKKFLVGLEKLTRETGIEIAGCGCCDSPFLSVIQKDAAPEDGYKSSRDGGCVSWTKSCAKEADEDEGAIHSKEEQDSEGHDDDI